MRNTATAAMRRRHAPAHGARTDRSNRSLLISILVVVVALGAGALLLVRGSARPAAAGADHTLGAATAPVVVEEWSDFE